MAEQRLTTRRSIDVNADVGEGADDDAALIPVLTSASVACGGHAGDDRTMLNAVRAAAAAGVVVGAHPGHADRANFGRVERPVTPADVAELVATQVRRLATIAGDVGAAVRYVKPHGALYHQLARDEPLANAFAAAVARLDTRLAVLGPPGSAMQRAATTAGLPFFAEAFADRAYLADGSLAPRSTPGGVIVDPSLAARQSVALATRGVVPAVDGEAIAVRADSLCVHGDSPGAAAMAAAVRAGLESAGVAVRPFCID